MLLLKQEDPVLLMVKDSRIAIDPATAKQITVSHASAGTAQDHGHRFEQDSTITLQATDAQTGGNGR